MLFWEHAGLNAWRSPAKPSRMPTPQNANHLPVTFNKAFKELPGIALESRCCGAIDKLYQNNDCRVGLVQMCAGRDVGKNIATAVELIRAAARGGPRPGGSRPPSVPATGNRAAAAPARRPKPPPVCRRAAPSAATRCAPAWCGLANPCLRPHWTLHSALPTGVT